jgi:hypothetical protein
MTNTEIEEINLIINKIKKIKNEIKDERILIT